MTTHHTNFSTKKHGDMRDRNNLTSFLASQNITYQSIIRPKQVHGDTVRSIETLLGEEIHTIPDCDGVITTSHNLALTVITADCVPISFVDKKNNVIGVSHQGWKGTQKRLAQKMIQKMTEAGAKKENIKVFIGPCISVDHYEVSKEIIDDFAAEFRAYEPTWVNGRQLNLRRLNELQLTEVEVPQQNITTSDMCTYSHHELFYSYRRDSKEEFGEIVTFVIQYSE